MSASRVATLAGPDGAHACELAGERGMTAVDVVGQLGVDCIELPTDGFDDRFDAGAGGLMAGELELGREHWR